MVAARNRPYDPGYRWSDTAGPGSEDDMGPRKVELSRWSRKDTSIPPLNCSSAPSTATGGSSGSPAQLVPSKRSTESATTDGLGAGVRQTRAPIHVIAPDLPGHGNPTSHARTTCRRLCQRDAGPTQRPGHRPGDGGRGHSLGGGVAMQFVISSCRMVERLVPVGAGGSP